MVSLLTKNSKTLRIKIHTGLNWCLGFLNLSNDFFTPWYILFKKSQGWGRDHNKPNSRCKVLLFVNTTKNYLLLADVT